jgi:hypothetical protein
MDLYYGIALSLHLGLPGEYNFLHPHVGLNYNDFIAGVYYNSQDELSLYAGYEFDISKDTTIEIGAVSGYDYGTVAPMIKFNHKNIFVTPSIDEDIFGFATGIDWRF